MKISFTGIAPKTKGVLFRAEKSKIHKIETTGVIKHGVEKVSSI